MPTYEPPERALCQHAECLRDAMPGRLLCVICATQQHDHGTWCFGCFYSLLEEPAKRP